MSVLNEHYAAKSNAFYDRYYSQLEGAKITRFYGLNEGFPTFEVELENCQIIRIEISRDPEGNGGGFIFGLNQPDMSDWTKKTAVLMSRLEAENV